MNADGGGAVSGSGGGTGHGGSLNVDAGVPPDASGGSAGMGDAATCVGDVRPAALRLDAYVMLDTSSAMLTKTAQASTTWDAVKLAFSTFVADPGSTGLGLGIQYFPLEKAGVPDSCTNDAQCGTGAPCLLKSCAGAGSVTPCNTDSDCATTTQCAPLGQCSGDPAYYCQPVGGNCSSGLGLCNQITTSVCAHSTSCLAGDYENPAVPIADLPGSAAAIVSSMSAQKPRGDTPTGPALEGVIAYAGAWATSHPDRNVVAVLITDGLATSCSPTDVSQLAKLASQGASQTPSIHTFVIGVMGMSNTTAKAALDKIALAGGTQQALFADTAKDVKQQLVSALDTIRSHAMTCDFDMPAPPEGGTLDYSQLGVEYTDANDATQQLAYVGEKAQCDPQTGGWYYDIAPDKGTPTRIIVCSSSCETYKHSGGAFQTRVGCGL